MTGGIPKLFGRMLENLKIFRDASEIGFDYILNPTTGELHYLHSSNFWGAHNLAIADLGNFIGVYNVGAVPIHAFGDGTTIPIYDGETGELIARYSLNKCHHCRFPTPAGIA